MGLTCVEALYVAGNKWLNPHGFDFVHQLARLQRFRVLAAAGRGDFGHGWIGLGSNPLIHIMLSPECQSKSDRRVAYMPQFGLYAGTPVAHVRTSLADFKKNDVCATRETHTRARRRISIDIRVIT